MKNTFASWFGQESNPFRTYYPLFTIMVLQNYKYILNYQHKMRKKLKKTH